MPTLVTNKKAYHHYQILEDYEAGIVLYGSEVKSAKQGHIDLSGSYVTIKHQELWLLHAHISLYAMASTHRDLNPLRERKLIMKRQEIDSMIGKLKSQRLTVVPLSVYTKGGLIKIKLGIGRGKKDRDKRDTIKKREVNRQIGRALRNKV